MLIVEFDRLPSWSLDASETGESTKCPWVGLVEGRAGGKNPYFFLPVHPHAMSLITPTHGHFELSQVSLASRDQDGSLSNSTIDIYNLTEK